MTKYALTKKYFWYNIVLIDREKSAKGIVMAKQDSFKKGTETAKSAGFKGAAKKLNVVNFAVEFGQRGISIGKSESVK